MIKEGEIKIRFNKEIYFITIIFVKNDDSILIYWDFEQSKEFVYEIKKY